MAEHIRFKGKVSFVEKGGKQIAKASYLDPVTRKRKQVWRTVTGRKSDAKESLINEIERRLNEKIEIKAAKTFNDLADYFIENRAIPAVFVENVKVAGMKTYKTVRHDIKVLRGYFGKMELGSITRDDIVKFRLAELKKPVRRVQLIDGIKQSFYKQKSLASVHHQIRTLSNMFACALEINWIDRAPSFKGLAQRSIENKRETIPTEAEFARLLEETRKAKQPVLTAFVLLIADCGGRPTELFGARWADVGLEDETITLTSDKGKKRAKRTVGLTPRLLEEIKKLPRTNEYLFGGIKSVKNSWNKARKRADFPYDMYTLRHYFSSRLERNSDLSDIEKMLIMGHSTQKMRLTYVKLSPDVLRLATKGLSENYDVQDLSENVQ